MTALDSLAPAAPQAPFGHKLAAPGDPLEGADFDAIYQQKIEPELIKCEADRKGALRTFLVALVGGAILVFLEYLMTPTFTNGASHTPSFFVVAISFAVVAGLGYLPLQSVAQKAKLGVIQSLCQPLGVTYQMKGAEAPSFGEFLSLNLLPRPSEKSFEDFFSGRRGQIDFALCEATLTQGSGKERHTVFQGQLFRLTTPKKLLSTTVVLRNTGWFSRFECPHGLQAVGLEDPRFNKIFAVFGSDQVEAREILTPAFMQELVDLETAYSGQHLRYAFVGAELLIAVEGANRFEIGSMFTTLVDRSRVEGIARDLEQVFKLIDECKDA
ncbi:MAG: DUF3137 domain-containing protein [Caulobacterales bacterium]